jgi:CBS domain-containing membrane protein
VSTHEEMFCVPVEITEDDILEAMRKIPGYLDITLDDFKRVYEAAFRHAVRRLSEDVRVEHVMSADVVTVSPETPLRDVAAKMAERRVSGVPVVMDEGRVVGVVSEKDFLVLMTGSGATFMEVIAGCVSGHHCLVTSVEGKIARDVMSSPAVVVRFGEPVMVAVDLMTERGINRLPVVNDEQRLLGIVSRGDTMRRALGADSR